MDEAGFHSRDLECGRPNGLKGILVTLFTQGKCAIQKSMHSLTALVVVIFERECYGRPKPMGQWVKPNMVQGLY